MKHVEVKTQAELEGAGTMSDDRLMEVPVDIIAMYGPSCGLDKLDFNDLPRDTLVRDVRRLLRLCLNLRDRLRELEGALAEQTRRALEAQNRVHELEAEVARLREALDGIFEIAHGCANRALTEADKKEIARLKEHKP